MSAVAGRKPRKIVIATRCRQERNNAGSSCAWTHTYVRACTPGGTRVIRVRIFERLRKDEEVAQSWGHSSTVARPTAIATPRFNNHSRHPGETCDTKLGAVVAIAGSSATRRSRVPAPDRKPSRFILLSRNELRLFRSQQLRRCDLSESLRGVNRPCLYLTVTCNRLWIFLDLFRPSSRFVLGN